MNKMKLGEVCQINPKDKPEDMTLQVSFIPMQSVSETGEIDTSDIRSISDVCKGFTSFSEGDVLMAKITPCMENGKGAIAKGLHNGKGYGSTEFFVLRPDLARVSSEWIYYFTAGRQFRRDCEKNMTGSAGQKRVPKTYLEKKEIPVPSLEKQRILVDNLKRTKKIISLRKQQLTELDTLVKARFVEMFGDPVNNERKWPTKPLSEICSTIVDCPHSTPSYTTENTGYMCIRTSIVKKNRILWDEIEYIPEHEFNQRIQRKRPLRGDIVYTREGAILGIAAVIDRDCNVALGQRSMLLSPDQNCCSSQFLCMAMNFDSFFRKATDGMSGSASPHINVGDIKTFNIIVPPIKNQKQFSTFVTQVNQTKSVVQKALDEAQTLFDSLMQQYFG